MTVDLKKIEELVAQWRKRAMDAVPPEYADRDLHYKYLKLDNEAAGWDDEEFVELGKQHKLRFLGGRLVVHYQIGEEAVARLEEVMKVVLEKKGSGAKKQKVGTKAYGT